MTWRPHFHYICFGYWPGDVKVWRVSPKGDVWFWSPKLSEIWGKGRVIVANVDWECCAYVARYVVKKLNGELKDFYDEFGLVPEFAIMSRKPGIGNQYFIDHPDLYEHKNIHISTRKGGRTLNIPQYFDYLMEKEDSEKIALIKAERKAVMNCRKNIMLNQTDLDYLSILGVKEDKLLKRLEGVGFYETKKN